MSAIGPAEIRAVVDALRPLGVETILIGANALVAQGIAAATYDVDVGVRRRDFDALERRLRELGWRIDVVGNSLSATSPGGEEVELIHPGPFGPRHDPDVFFEYLRGEGSVGTELGRAARPEAVWYMRLGFEPEAGRQKVLQDIRLGLFADPGAPRSRGSARGAHGPQQGDRAAPRLAPGAPREGVRPRSFAYGRRRFLTPPASPF